MAPSRLTVSESEHSSTEDVSMTMNDANLGASRDAVDSTTEPNHDFYTPDYTDSDTNPNTTASSIAGDLQRLDNRKRRSEALQLRKSVFGKKLNLLDESKTNDSIRRFRYLLGLTDLFRHFIETNPNAQIRDILGEIDRQDREEELRTKKGHSRKGGATVDRRRRTEQEEDAELIREEKHGVHHNDTSFHESPAFIKGGTMRDYQVSGLNWLISLHENGISGILADEMGLGKTLQTISFIGYLRFVRSINGPHLVAVPKSTLDNWRREFNRWVPEIDVIVLQGAKDERQGLISGRLAEENFDVCITSYEMILREKAALNKHAWEYIIIDEAHRIKNEESSLAQIIRVFRSRNRLLITGTPLQNNLHELWALLNFLLPDVFGDSDAFDQWFQSRDETEETVVQQLHRVLRPFLLRRVKADVEKALKPKKEVNVPVDMTDMQKRWYRKILEKDLDAVNGGGGKKESKTRLLNIVMQLRKCCNHPYLFDGAEPGPPYTTDEHLVRNSAKLKFLDRLLKKWQVEGSRVLIFSQMSRVLDIMEDYCVMRGYQYCRIDGSTAHEDRISAIDGYNKPGSEKFIFLLTTRAGGLGINLTSADIVVLYDSDWNPQADLQAMDRAHRIGQTKQVKVYRFVTRNAIEEKVLERAAQKRRLDQVVIQQGRAQLQPKPSHSKDELLSMIQHGAEGVFEAEPKGEKSAKDEDGNSDEELDIDKILAEGEVRTAELNKKYESLGIDDLQNFKSESVYEWDGQKFVVGRPTKTSIGVNWIEPLKRERKEQVYSIDNYYRQMLKPGGGVGGSSRPTETRQRLPRAPKQIVIQDYQFFSAGLQDLYDKETAWYRKENNIKAPLSEGTEENIADRQADQGNIQTEIDNAIALTEDEIAKKDKLSQQGFGDWNRRDFQQFINGSAKYGRYEYAKIATEVDSKSNEQCEEYANAFWKNFRRIANYEKYIAAIEEGEERLQKVKKQAKLLRKKIGMYHWPLQQMKLSYTLSTTNKKVYTEDEDRFLLVKLDKHGIDVEGVYEKIRDEIRRSTLFRFDWFFLSRTPIEIGRRCTTLLNTVMKEFETGQTKINGSSSAAPSATPVSNGKRKVIEADEEEDEEDEAPAKKKAKNGVAKNKAIDTLKPQKTGKNSKGNSANTSRAASVLSTGSASTPKSKSRRR